MDQLAQSIPHIESRTDIPKQKIAKVLQLLVNEKCTVPFIARYRKEFTGNLDEVQIRDVEKYYNEHLEMEKRRAYILETIEKMEKLTPALKAQIMAADSLNVLEDIYAPYKSKKKTKAQMAKDKGLEPLSKIILETKLSKEELETAESANFVKGDVKTFAEAYTGAFDIIIEMFAHDIDVKEKIRSDVWERGEFVSDKKKDAEKIDEYHKFQDYFEYRGKVKDLCSDKTSHRYLAMRRGMSLKVLKIEIDSQLDHALDLLRDKYFDLSKDLGLRAEIEKAATKAYNLYIHPSLDLEIKTDLKKKADGHAIDVFCVNLKNLLLSPYLGNKTVIGIDPGVRTGCKIVVVDKTGTFLLDTVIYPHPPKDDIATSAKVVSALIEKFNAEYIAIGNGTYGRETLQFVEDNVPQVMKGDVKATMISESGASIYSASDIAREEFPDKDTTVRGSISIARRFQDPLAELVKIDPKSIGVGQYQHDVAQTRLKKSLHDVVESCVNYVGVNINTASAPLLSYVSGIGPSVAKNIVKHREKNGQFKNREALLEIARFTQKTFEQAAGFLRIYEGENPLDSTFIHPERYETLRSWAKTNGVELADLVSDDTLILKLSQDKALKEDIGELTLKDIIDSLKAPSQDPRSTFKTTEFEKSLRNIEDVKVGAWYTGVVTNITKFGAFVDIGIKENGLVHVSQLSDSFVENALDVVKVGDEVKVRVIDIDMARKRISLSCKKDAQVTGKASNANASAPKERRGGKGNSRPNIAGKQLKNNAFASLKNFKVK